MQAQDTASCAALRHFDVSSPLIMGCSSLWNPHWASTGTYHTCPLIAKSFVNSYTLQVADIAQTQYETLH